MTTIAIITDAVEIAFQAAGDLVQSVTWRKVTLGDYDPTAGERSVTNADAKVRAIEDEITAGEFSRLSLSQRAVKLLIPAVDFKTGDPVFDDKLIHRGTVYTAKECKFVGAKALWEIFADV